VRLADFGVARSLSNSDVTGPGTAPKGKQGYMAPEQAAGKPIGPQADIFALGRVIAEAADVSCGSALRAVLDKATAPAPRDRFASAEQLAQALFAACPPPSDAIGALGLWLARAAPEALVPAQTSPGNESDAIPPPPEPRKPFVLDLASATLAEPVALSEDGPVPLPGRARYPGVPVASEPPPLFAAVASRRSRGLRILAMLGVVLGIALPVTVIVAAAEGRTSIGPIHLPGFHAPRGELRVRSAPPGAEVYVDGTLRGTSPLTLRLAEGRHAVRIGNPRLEHWRAAEVTLRKDSVQALDVDLTE
jgi:hypothetical protein